MQSPSETGDVVAGRGVDARAPAPGRIDAGAPAPGRVDVGSPAPGRALGLSRGLWNRVRTSPLTGASAVLLLLVVLLIVREDRFLTSGNLTTLVRTNAVLLIIAVGMTPVVISGGFDLSPGALLALTGIVFGAFLRATPELLAIALAIVFAGLLGLLVNGLIIARGNLAPFVVTLATLTIYRGLANVLTEGQTELIPDSPIVEVLAEGSVGPVPIPALIGIAVIVGFVYLLRFTYFGRNIYAIGGNEEAARLAGIRVVLIKMSVYGLLGLTVGLATVLQTGRLAAASPTVGSGLELVALAAVLLGGTHLGGGQGSVAGTVVGVLLLATIHNGLTISGVSLFWQGVITGAVLLVAVGFDRFRRPWAQ